MMLSTRYRVDKRIDLTAGYPHRSHPRSSGKAAAFAGHRPGQKQTQHEPIISVRTASERLTYRSLRSFRSGNGSHRYICASDKTAENLPAPYAAAPASLFCPAAFRAAEMIRSRALHFRPLSHLFVRRGGDRRDLPRFAAVGRIDLHILERHVVDLRKEPQKSLVLPQSADSFRAPCRKKRRHLQDRRRNRDDISYSAPLWAVFGIHAGLHDPLGDGTIIPQRLFRVIGANPAI